MIFWPYIGFVQLSEMRPTLVCNTVFEKEVISYLTQLKKRPQQTSFIMCLSESTQICATRVLFRPLFSCNFDDQVSPSLRRLIILYIALGYPK